MNLMAFCSLTPARASLVITVTLVQWKQRFGNLTGIRCGCGG